MSAEPILHYVFSPHALYEMKRRGLGEELVRKVLKEPAQRWEVRPGRHVLQAKVHPPRSPRVYLIRVFVDVDRNPAEVVTAYRTGKIEKYWRKEP